MTEEPRIEQKESIKLTKNAKGDYQWEIKVISESGLSNTLDDADVKRLEKINKELNDKYGGK